MTQNKDQYHVIWERERETRPQHNICSNGIILIAFNNHSFESLIYSISKVTRC